MPNFSYIENDLRREIIEDCFRKKFELVKKEYQDLIELGVKKEDARAILPNATTCNLVVTMDLNNFRNFLRQRLCEHAQTEIKELAREMTRQVKDYVPFIDYKVLRCQQGLCDSCK